MGSKILKTAKRKVKLDARADRADIRDRIYQPPLVSLPAEFPSKERIANYLPAYRKAGLVLDQGEDGACTGFGLGALINYLLFAQSVADGAPPPGRISTRMLYHLARKYDEWPGEDYEGSSCRGAFVSSGYPFQRSSSRKGTGANFGYAQIVPAMTSFGVPWTRACSSTCAPIIRLANQ